MSKIIAHIDMNCFYASVEEKYNPSLKNTPIAIAGNVRERHGIIITSNYKARSYGIKTTMRVGEAKKLCPTLKLLKPKFENYQIESKKVFDLIKTYTKNVEIVSIDEAYIDLSLVTEPIKTMAIIQKRIYKELDLPSSVGLSYNKFFAKMASDMKKPKGFTIINRKNFKKLLWDMDVEKMHGCGKASAKKLKNYGINTIGELANANSQILKSLLGIQGLGLKEKALGEDRRKLNYHTERKSIGNSKTYIKDLYDDKEISLEIKKLAKKVSDRANNQSYIGNHLSITIKFADFKTITRGRKLPDYINDEKNIYQYALDILFENYNFDKGIRLLGVSLNDVKKKNEVAEQLDFFNHTENQRNNELRKVMRLLNEKYGKEVVKEVRLENKKENIISTSFSKDFLDD